MQQILNGSNDKRISPSDSRTETPGQMDLVATLVSEPRLAETGAQLVSSCNEYGKLINLGRHELYVLEAIRRKKERLQKKGTS